MTRTNAEGEASLEFGGEPEGDSKITCQRAGTSSIRSTAPGEERWYVKYHRLRNRRRALRRSASVEGAIGRRSATNASSELQPREVGLKWSRRLYDLSLKNSWGVRRQGRRVPKSIIAQTPPIESAAKESARVEKTPIGRASREPWPFEGSLEIPGQRKLQIRWTRVSNTAYFFKKKPFKERDIRKMIKEVDVTSWRRCECIRTRELSATHRLEQI